MIWNHRQNHGRSRPRHLSLLRLCLKLIPAIGACASVSLALGFGPAAIRVQASQVTSNIKLDTEDLNHPVVLDQNGKLVHLPTAQHPGPVVMPAGAIPTYIGYRIDANDSTPTGLPTVRGDLATAPQTVGPLHLDALDLSQLNAALAQSGQAIVHSTDNQNLLVEPMASFFGSMGAGSGTSSKSSTLAWLAARTAATSAATPSTSTPSTSSASGSSTTTPAAQTLIPSSVTSAITNNNVIKDLQHLLQIKSGKLVNWNQQTLDALQKDLGLGTPHNVAPHLASNKPQPAAEELAPLSTSAATSGVPQPAPIPEPGTLVIFGLSAGALVLRRRLHRATRAA
jgi:hypothetical protein